MPKVMYELSKRIVSNIERGVLKAERTDRYFAHIVDMKNTVVCLVSSKNKRVYYEVPERALIEKGLGAFIQ